jgi:ankyrin repeat protein
MFGLTQKEKDALLDRALEHGKIDVLKRALDKGANPNHSGTYYHAIPLFQVPRLNSEETAIGMAKLLIDRGAKLDKKDSDGRTILHCAIYRNGKHIDLLRTLVEAGADVLATDSQGGTALLKAIDGSAWDAAEFLLEKGGDAKAADNSGRTLLMAGIAVNAPIGFLKKIAGKTDINAVARDKTSALQLAVARGVKQSRDDEDGKDGQEYVDWLLTLPGINIDIPDKKGRVPLLAAIDFGRTGIARSLLAAGAATDIADKEKDYPLTSAARSHNQEMVEALAAAGAALDQPDGKGLTPLAIAARDGSIRMVMTLLGAADSRKEKLDLIPPLFAAAEKGHGRVLELLIAAGADVNALDADGRTPLMNAALSDQVEVLSILIKAGAKPDMGDRHGMAAYDHAVTGAKTKAKDFLARYRHETVKTGDTVTVAAPVDDYHFIRVNDHSLEVREGEGLSMTFNFWTQQVIFRDIERPAPVTVQNFADIQRQDAIEEAYNKLKDLGGNPPDPKIASITKRSPGLGKP